MIAIILALLIFVAPAWAGMGTLGEGYSAPSLSEGIDVGPRAFTIYTLKEACEGPHPTRLVAREDHIQLRSGQVFHMRDVSIVAVDSEGKVMKPVPITVDSDATSEMIDTWNFGAPTDEIRALRPGKFRMRFRALCSHPAPEVTIYYTVK